MTEKFPSLYKKGLPCGFFCVIICEHKKYGKSFSFIAAFQIQGSIKVKFSVLTTAFVGGRRCFL